MNKYIHNLISVFLYLIIPVTLHAMEGDKNIAEVNINEAWLNEKENFKDTQALIDFLSHASAEDKLPADFKAIKNASELIEEHKVSRYGQINFLR